MIFDGFQQSVFGANGLSSQITQLAGQVTSVVTDLGDITNNTNLIPYWEQGDIDAYGADLESKEKIRTQLIKVDSGQIYIAGTMAAGETSIACYFYDQNKKYIRMIVADGAFGIPSNGEYVRLRKTTAESPYTAKYTLQKGTHRYKFNVVNTQSQYTQLSTMINLRVQKGDVLGQINIEAGTTLIQQTGNSGKIILDAATVHFTGKAFIPSAAITELVADKLTVGSTLNAANVNVINLNAYNISSGYLNSARILAGSITANHLAANAIRVGFNNMGNTMELSATSLSFYDSGKQTFGLYSSGMRFYDGSTYIGQIGKAAWAGKPTVRGLLFNLDHFGDYMTWAYLQSSGSANSTAMLTMDARGRAYGEVGLHLGANLHCQNRSIKNGYLLNMGVSAGSFKVYNNVNLQFFSNLNMNGFSVTNQSGYSLKAQFETINPTES